MKEATGDLNMTVVVVIIVAVLASFFFGVLWPMLRTNFNHNTKCDEAICECERVNGKCVMPSDGMVKCHLKGEKDQGKDFYCQWKG